MDVHLLSDYGKAVSAKRKASGTLENGLRLNENKPERDQKELKKTKVIPSATSGHLNPTPELTTFGGIKLGWIQGVLIPCLLNIWGVMLFLRISWIVAQAGIGLTLVIICIAGVVCVITTLSLSAICTNGELRGGGVYYIVSRSLGAELGASVGIVFAFANAVAASMNTIGFCDSLNELLKSHGLKIVDNSVNDVRIVGAVALLVMCVICAIGMDWETKTQNFLITVIVVAIANYIIGACLAPRNDIQVAQGFVGINLENAGKNFYPDFRYSEGASHNFFSVFAMYFPAVTGVQAGANICGDLKNPATAIPKGTFMALGISTTSYLVMAVLCGMGALRDASGDSTDLNVAKIEACKPNCDYGLHHNYEVMQLMSLWGPLIYSGCWAATLSTALTNLLSVPRLIQALGLDRIYPGLIFFSKPYGRHGEPYRGYVLTFFVSLAFLLIAELNTIAPLITNFYLASYALINFCTFHAAIVYPISWRPTFRHYNAWVSLFGVVICVSIMMVISWVMALATTLIFITLYLLVLYTKPETSWGSSTEAQRYQSTVASVLAMSRRVEHVKCYSPQVLVLAGRSCWRPALLDVGHLITRHGSFMIVADIEETKMSYSDQMDRIREGEDWLMQNEKLRAFYVLLHGLDVETGVKVLTQTTGLGKLRPNILLIGFKTNWTSASVQEIGSYVRIIQGAFETQLAVTILRVPTAARHVRFGGGLFSSTRSSQVSHSEITVHSQLMTLMHSSSDLDGQNMCEDKPHPDDATPLEDQNPSEGNLQGRKLSMTNTHKTNIYEPLKFPTDKSIDAWWLYDDGGINILLPYIIAHRGFKETRFFRIFALAKSQLRKEDAQRHMKSLLAKFRIEYKELIMVRGLDDAPSEESWSLFHSIGNCFKTDQHSSDILITETEFKRLYEKTCRHLRLRELLLENSSSASFIVMSLPIPRKGSISASLYMTWLEVLSKDLPPMMFVRGNDVSVLDA